MFAALGEKFAEKDREPAELAIEIEQALVDLFGEGTESYKDKYRVIAQNLRDPENVDLNMRVLCGEITPKVLVELKTEELASDQHKAKLKEIDEYNKTACRSDLPIIKQDSMTDEYKCSRCHSRRCTYFQKQTRSADEPMTTFITCTSCGKRWRD